MKKELVTSPYCAVCGAVRPEEFSETFCQPCINAGHFYRLVLDESDRLQRIRRWTSFYSKNGYTEREIKNIPMFQNLIGKTFNKNEVSE